MEQSMKHFIKIGIKYNSLGIVKEENQLERIKEEIENLFIGIYFPYNTTKGLKMLKQTKKKKSFTSKDTWLMGVFISWVICFLFLLTLNYISFDVSENPGYALYFPMWRAIGLFLLYYFLLGINVWGWNKFHINYKQIFKFNHHYSSQSQIFKRCFFFIMTYFILFYGSMAKIHYLYLYNMNEIPLNKQASFVFFDPALGPLIFWLIFFSYMVFPSYKMFNALGRKYFFKLIFFSILSPCYILEFRYNWLVGQLISFVGPFKDSSYTLCFYFHYFVFGNHYPTQCSSKHNIESNLIMATFPIILKMMQIIKSGHDQSNPIYLNYTYLQGKFFFTTDFYKFLRFFISFMTAIISYIQSYYPEIFNFWLAVAILNAIVSFYWDVAQDWGFFEKNSQYKFLRNDLAYPNLKFYYFCLIVDLPLRFSWTLSICPNLINIIHIYPQFVIMIISSLEIFRRFLWNFLMLEMQQLRNEGEFQAVPQMVFPYQEKYEKKKRQNQMESNYYQSQGSNERFTIAISEMIDQQESMVEEKVYEMQEYSLNNEDSIQIRQTYKDLGREVKSQKIENRERFKQLSKNIKEIKYEISQELKQTQQ